MRPARLVLLSVLLLQLLACAAPRVVSTPTLQRPYVVVLGTAQDGGLPQLACGEACCRAARADAARRRLVTSLLLVDPRSGKRWLFDATPDLAEQVERARPHFHPERTPGGPARPALFDGVFLTHGHMGHYAGLLALGREAYGSAPQTVHASRAMAAFLRGNAPWSLLVDAGHVELAELDSLAAVALAPDLSVLPLRVPHRQELSDTLAFVIRGPERSLLYLPDLDAWDGLQPAIEELLATVDVALVDGTFFDGGELPGRDLSRIPHPFVASSVERFSALAPEERAKVRFTHLNHSNPAADPASPAARRVRAAGLAIARDGERHDL